MKQYESLNKQVDTNVNYNNYKYSSIIQKQLNIDDLSKVEDFPLFLSINTVDLCNAKCIMCPHENKKGGGIIDDYVWNKIFNEISKYSDMIEMINLYWFGEPCLDPQLTLRIKMLHDNGIKRIQISTNAELLTPDKAKDFLMAGLNDIRISIDSMNKERYEKIRVGLNYNHVIENVHNLIKIRDCDFQDIPIRIRMVELDANHDERNLFLDYWQKYLKNIDRVELLPPVINKNWGNWNECFTEEYPCVSVFSTLTIDIDGSVYLCCMDTNKEVYLGNVINSPIKDIWNCGMIKTIRSLHLKGEKGKISICNMCNAWQKNTSRGLMDL